VAEFRQSFGLAVRIFRERRHWRQEDLARAAGITRAYVSRIESGAVGLGIDTQRRIAEALGVELSELMSQAEEEQERRRRRLGLEGTEDPPA
jgi:transcriptional regulator with XRE-family HTH domain